VNVWSVIPVKKAQVMLERNPLPIMAASNKSAVQHPVTVCLIWQFPSANGGYLVLPMEDVLRNPLTWDSLKRALENKEIIIEDVGEKIGLISSRSLRPEPIPLTIKVILIGRLDVYQLLLAYDDNFTELFKVKADFDTSMPWTEENAKQYASFVSMICENEKLRHLDAAALALLVEHGARLAEDQEKLSTHFGVIADVIRRPVITPAGASCTDSSPAKLSMNAIIAPAWCEHIKEMARR
jgi:hypothetical protein